MAEMKGVLTVRADNFFTATRIRICLNKDCKFNMMRGKGDADLVCELKMVEIDKDGRCLMQEDVYGDKSLS